MVTKHAAIYIRVSTDAQAEEGYSIEAQKEQLTAYCVSRRITKYEYYIDGGWSGSNINRPEIQRLIRDVMDNKISHCIVYKLDRLSRSQKDTLYLIEDVFNPRGVAFVSLNETMDTSTPMGRLMIGILSAFAQLERENIRLRTRMGMKERVKAGYWPGGGRTPFGYDYDREQGILVPNEDAEKVRQIYDLYTKGYSGQYIADLLGLKYDKLAMQILRRKSNYGIIEYNGEEYQGRHEPIITKETYDRAMAELEKRSMNNITTSLHLLTGLLYCGKCGAKMHYQRWGKDAYKICCYSQQKSKKYLIKDPNCDQERFSYEDVEKAVIETMFRLGDRKIDINSEKQEYESIVSILNTQKTELEQKLKRLYHLYSEADSDMLLETIREHEKKLENIKKQILNEMNQAKATSKKEQIATILEGLPEKWEFMTTMERQNIVRTIVNRVTITGKDIKINFNV